MLQNVKLRGLYVLQNVKLRGLIGEFPTKDMCGDIKKEKATFVTLSCYPCGPK